MEGKYFKPKSVTWWSGFAMTGSGAFMAFTPVHELTELTSSLTSLYGGMTPAMLINGGLAIIGLRGAK